MTDDLISRAAAIAAMAPMLRSMISRGYAVEAIRALPAIGTQPDPRDAVIARLVEALEYADRMVRLDLIHMTDFNHDDFSQAVVDTGKRIAAALSAAKGGAA